MSRTKIDSRILTGLSESEQDKIKDAYQHGTPVNDRIIAILKEEIRANVGSTPTEYDSPGWAYRRADKDGYIRGLKLALKLQPGDNDV